MYKSRFSTWLFILMLALAGNWVACNWDTYFHAYSVYSDVGDVQTDVQINAFDSLTNFKTVSVKADADVVIAKHSDAVIDGYTKHEKLLYSPLVMYAWNANTQNSGYSMYVDNKMFSIMSVDFNTFLTAFENDKSYRDIGINADGKIAIGIPDETNLCYNDIVELFYVTLNDNKIPTDGERMALKERVNAIIDKCSKFMNVKQQLEHVKKENKDKSYDMVFIAPEMIANNSSESQAFSLKRKITYARDSWGLVYLSPCTSQSFDVFIKDTYNDKILCALEKSEICTHVGLRSRNGCIIEGWYHCPKSLSPVN